MLPVCIEANIDIIKRLINGCDLQRTSIKVSWSGKTKKTERDRKRERERQDVSGDGIGKFKNQYRADGVIMFGSNAKPLNL